MEEARLEEEKLTKKLDRDHYMEELEQGKFADLLMLGSMTSGSSKPSRTGSRAASGLGGRASKLGGAASGSGRVTSGAGRSTSTSSGYNSIGHISSEDPEDIFGKESHKHI